MASMIAVSKDNIFALSNDMFSYVFRVTPEAILEHLYYGDALRDPLNAPVHHRRTHRDTTVHYQGHADFNLNDTPQEIPVFGTSDFRAPAFHGRNADGNSVFSFVYKGYEITEDKLDLPGLPSARGGDSETLTVTLEDALYGLEVKLYYTVYRGYGVLVRSTEFTNKGSAPIKLEQVFSSSLDLPADDYEVLHLHGTWAREFNEERFGLPQGRFVIDSARGTSSAAHNPFMALLGKGASEDHGRVFASTLIYSGNFAISAEKGEFGDVRLLTGINPFNFGWTLGVGESFATPEALHVYSGRGLRGMSHMWHDFIRDKISPPNFKRRARPTYVNTWEAAYFDVTEEAVLALADKSKDIGAEMLVLDDGWFEGRQSDRSSLGDWTADKTRFPSGIPDLAAKVKAKGLKFGIWLEPEMVNPDSDLYRAHPDWTLHVVGRTPSTARNQLTLDLSRGDVVDYLFEKMDVLLSCGNIDYVKWDMNRHMSELGSAVLPPEKQCETAHRYMLGLYDLLGRLTQKYPDVLFENCASGGNRFDLGMLSFMAQNWPSDMCDPIGRLDIINGASYLFPMDVLTAYIGPSPNHQNGRETSLEERFHAGVLCAAQGVSLGHADLETHGDDLKHYMAMAKATATNRLGGSFSRIIKNENETCWQLTSADANTIYLTYFHILSGPNQPFRRVRLSGLDPNAQYRLEGGGAAYGGDALMQSGLPLPYVAMTQNNSDMRYMPRGDFSSYLFVLKKAA
ncbi:MAG: alpha-galactosidase [Maricaulaceae bacterium]